MSVLLLSLNVFDFVDSGRIALPRSLVNTENKVPLFFNFPDRETKKKKFVFPKYLQSQVGIRNGRRESGRSGCILQMLIKHNYKLIVDT